MKIYLHIGTENTGTTSIQKFFLLNRKELKKQGIYYPNIDESNHVSLTLFASNNFDRISGLIPFQFSNKKFNKDTYKNNIETKLSTEISKLSKNIHTIIFSNEHCSSRLLDVDEMSILKGLLEKISNEIKIVVYIKRQDELLLSQYNTYVKSGGTDNKAEYINYCYDSNNPNYYNNWVTLNKWASIFGKENLIIRVFDKPKLLKGSIIHDFLDLLNIKTNDRYVFPEPQNKSFDNLTIEFLRNFNKHIPLYTVNGVNHDRYNIDEILASFSEKKYKTTNPLRLNQFYTSFEESNKLVAKAYFNRDVLFDETNLYKYSPEEEKSQEITIDEAFKIFSKIWISGVDHNGKGLNKMLHSKIFIYMKLCLRFIYRLFK